jgi:hypothetical protein
MRWLWVFIVPVFLVLVYIFVQMVDDDYDWLASFFWSAVSQ